MRLLCAYALYFQGFNAISVKWTVIVKWVMMRLPSPPLEPFIGVAAFFVTFFLIGLWHGQTSIFILYGLLLGLGTSTNKLYQVVIAKWLGRPAYRALTVRPIYRLLCQGMTFSWFSLCLGCFWSDWPTLYNLQARIGIVGVISAFLVVSLVAGVVIALVETVWQRIGNLKERAGPNGLERRIRPPYRESLLWISSGSLVTIVCVLTMIASSDAANEGVVYFNF